MNTSGDNIDLKAMEHGAEHQPWPFDELRWVYYVLVKERHLSCHNKEPVYILWILILAA